MRYDLVIHRRATGKQGYLGQALGKTEADRWAHKRLGRADAVQGDKVTAHRTGCISWRARRTAVMQWERCDGYGSVAVTFPAAKRRKH